jgi:hypothetical protein
VHRRCLLVLTLAVTSLAGCAANDDGDVESGAPGPVSSVTEETTAESGPATSASAATTAAVPSASSDPTTAPPAAGVPVPEILQFQAELVGGGQLDAGSLAGTGVALWFWAPT